MAKKVSTKAPAKKAPATREVARTSQPKASASKEVAIRKSNTSIVTADERFLAAPTGLENVRQEDILIPRIKLLQKLSPQCLRTKPEYIEGAAEGLFFDTSTKELFDGLELLCCHFQVRFIEWNPRKDDGGDGKGFVADHGQDPSVTKGLPYEDYRWHTKDGNHIVDTRTFYCLNLVGGYPRPCVFSLVDSQSTVARGWITAMKNVRIMNSKGQLQQAPAYFQSYKVGTVLAHNDDGEWVKWDFQPGTKLQDMDNWEALFDDCRALTELGRSDSLRSEPEEEISEAASQGPHSSRSM